MTDISLTNLMQINLILINQIFITAYFGAVLLFQRGCLHQSSKNCAFQKAVLQKSAAILFSKLST